MVFGILAAVVLVIFCIREENRDDHGIKLEVERLRRDLSIEQGLKETFREAFLRQKAMYDRDIQNQNASQSAV